MFCVYWDMCKLYFARYTTKHDYGRFNPLSPRDAIKHRFTSENRPNFPPTDGFRRNISMKLFFQYMAIFF